VLLIAVKAVQATVANWALEARFSEWLSNPDIRSGLPVSNIVSSAVFMALIAVAAMVHYSFPGRFSLLTEFPTDPDYRLFSIEWVEAFFAFCVANGEVLFDFITYCIRMVLDALELVFVSTPGLSLRR
jgi:glycine betaine/proline transport system permease protein